MLSVRVVLRCVHVLSNSAYPNRSSSHLLPLQSIVPHAKRRREAEHDDISMWHRAGCAPPLTDTTAQRRLTGSRHRSAPPPPAFPRLTHVVQDTVDGKRMQVRDILRIPGLTCAVSSFVRVAFVLSSFLKLIVHILRCTLHAGGRSQGICTFGCGHLNPSRSDISARAHHDLLSPFKLPIQLSLPLSASVWCSFALLQTLPDPHKRLTRPLPRLTTASVDSNTGFL